MSLAAGTRIGSYEIVSAIGAGGMGEVFLGRDTKLNRDVAINHSRIAQIYNLRSDSLRELRRLAPSR
jgi:eukaryotic-like serine/threonine-protein kinase